MLSVKGRLLRMVVKNPSYPEKCWGWKGATHRGYARFHFLGKNVSAHRLSYALFVGNISTGMTIDHLCRNKRCVNPSHLEAVTNKVNILRGTGPTAINARKKHCINGHEFTFENTYRYKNGSGGMRVCVTCAKLNSIRNRRKEKLN